MNEPLRELGRKVAREQEEAIAEGTALSEAREKFARSLAARTRPQRTRAPVLVAASVALAAAALLVFLRVDGRRDALSYSVDGDAIRSEARFVDAASTPRSLKFSDGSDLTLGPQSALRVLEASADGAHVALERGTLDVHVVHRNEDTRWRFEVGPYRVFVIGTRFELDYERDAGRFALTMREGKVRVVGPSVDRTLAKDERFVAGGSVGDDATSGPKQEPTPDASVPKAVEQDPSAETEKAEATHQPEPVVSPEAEAAEIKLGVLVQRAERVQKEDPPAAKKLLHQIRTEHAGTQAASDAAFMLARLEGDSARAVVLLEAYLREQPRGRFADAALGRLIRATRKLGELSRAREHAQRYLELYPSGPYAAEARQVVPSMP